MSTRKLFYLCCCLFLAACSAQEDVAVVELSAPEVFLADESLNDPYSFAVSDKYLIL